MSGPSSQQSRRQASAGGSPISGERLFAEWRTDVNHQLDGVAGILQQVQLGMERVNQTLADQGRRIEALERAPDIRERKNVAGVGLYANLVYLGLLMISLVISVSTHISWH